MVLVLSFKIGAKKCKIVITKFKVHNNFGIYSTMIEEDLQLFTLTSPIIKILLSKTINFKIMLYTKKRILSDSNVLSLQQQDTLESPILTTLIFL